VERNGVCVAIPEDGYCEVDVGLTEPVPGVIRDGECYTGSAT
jgi:hypothetical protein